MDSSSALASLGAPIQQEGRYLTDRFLEPYKTTTPKHAGILFDVIRLRYAIPVLDNGRYRLEKWWETCRRQTEYSMSLYSGPASYLELRAEAESMFDQLFHLLSLPSGRSLRIGGTRASEKYPESNFNCSFTNISRIEDFLEIFHLSLCSSGIGFKITKDLVGRLPGFQTEFEVSHDQYNTIYPEQKIDETVCIQMTDSSYLIQVGDSKKGWVDALGEFFKLLLLDHPVKINFNYDCVRKEGERLHTWGGRAAGPGGLRKMFEKLESIIKRSSGILTAVDCLDICNIIGKNVVTGGSRRAAEIALFDPDETDCIEAKFGDKLGWFIWTESGERVDFAHYDQDGKFNSDQFNDDKFNEVVEWYANPEHDHRTMSNNSIVFKEKPTPEKLHEIFQTIRFNGEPGFFNLQAAQSRRPNAEGLNPCGEIILDSKGVCNLSTTPLTSHLVWKNGHCELNWESLEQAHKNCVRIGLRQTNVTLSLPEWDAIQKRDRLLGVSLTGEMDAVDKLGWEPQGVSHLDMLRRLSRIANKEADRYASEMRIPRPLLVTAVKPEGSLSLLSTVSQGIHRAWAPYYLRRMKFASYEPVARALISKGVPFEKDKTKRNSNRLVFEFPIASGAPMKAHAEPFEDQFNRYLMHQDHYTDHNTSCSLYVGDDEWELAEQMVYDNWEEIVAVSFFPKEKEGKRSPYNQPPHESISKEEYDRRVQFFNVDLSDLSDIVDRFENGEHEDYAIDDSACQGGACPIV